MESFTLLAAEGEQRKRCALNILAARREVYVRRGRRALLGQLLAFGSGTIDDVRAAVPIPDTVNPKLFGAIPGLLAEAGLIRRAGFIQTARPQAHARPIALWELANREGALAWLASHPDLPDADVSAPGNILNEFLF